ncbi:uncharacterized protein J3D65DRAFT_608405, partial [Phyllosticta citribraziliensis]
MDAPPAQRLCLIDKMLTLLATATYALSRGMGSGGAAAAAAASERRNGCYIGKSNGTAGGLRMMKARRRMMRRVEAHV